jgi:DNA-binding transcriptional LysR family regulator
MNTELLREFLTFAESLNVTVAAKTLHISQPTLSRHIADLEADLGCELITHDASIGLTYAGETLLGEANQLLRCENNLRAAVSRASEKFTMSLRLEYYPYMCSVTSYINKALNMMQEQNPEAHLDVDFIQPKKQRSITECVLDGYYDFAILARTGYKLEDISEEPQIGVYPLDELASPICFFMSIDHPLASRKTLSITDLNGVQVQIPVNQEFKNFREDMRRLFEAHNTEPIEIPCRINSLADFAHGDIGMRVHVLTEDDLSVENSPYLTNPNCTIVRCTDEITTIPYFLYRKDTKNPAVKSFLEAMDKVRK